MGSLRKIMLLVWSFWQKVKAWYRNLPGWFRASVTTAWITYVSTVLPALLRFVADLQGWIAGENTVPDASVLARLVAGGFVTFIAFIINAILRRVRPPESVYKEPPQ